jgi:hypothetical protein
MAQVSRPEAVAAELSQHEPTLEAVAQGSVSEAALEPEAELS